MKINLGHFVEVTVKRMNQLIKDLETNFAALAEGTRHAYQVTLNFSAPGAVPGITSQTVTIIGVEVGDVVHVGAPVAAPAGFLPPFAEVTAADTVKVHWFQFSGAAANPDGAGGAYNIDVWRH